MTTIKDVARLAGVGVGTASRVLSGKGSFSQDAAQRVMAATKQLEFRPSATARALSLKNTGTIGVFVPNCKGPFHGTLLLAIDQELRRYGRHMVLANGCGDEDERQQALDATRFLLERDCDGLIVVSNALREADFIALRKRCPHLAVLNRDVKGMKSHCFTVDHVQAGGLAAQTLWDYGHRRMAVIAGPEAAWDSRQRLRGFFEVLARCGIAAETVPMESGDFSEQSGWNATERLLESKKRFTALFCTNDQMAMGALGCLHHAGVAVPAQLSVIGYDDVNLAAFLAPRLTSVHIPLEAMSLHACRTLLNACYGLELPVLRSFSPSIVFRDSLARVIP